jgi:hypothetical protein
MLTLAVHDFFLDPISIDGCIADLHSEILVIGEPWTTLHTLTTHLSLLVSSWLQSPITDRRLLVRWRPAANSRHSQQRVIRRTVRQKSEELN